MKAIMKHTGLNTIDGVIPNEIGGLNAFEALLASHHFKTSALDTDLVARAYPMLYQTICCLNGVPITPAALSNGVGTSEVHLLQPAITYTKLTLPDLHNSRLPRSRRPNARHVRKPRITSRSLHKPSHWHRSQDTSPEQFLPWYVILLAVHVCQDEKLTMMQHGPSAAA